MRITTPAFALLTVLLAALAGGPGAAQAPEAGEAPDVALGRLLFWDPILSGDRDVACATCHHPDFAYADGRELSLGAGSVGLGPDRVDRSGGAVPAVRRNSPTVLNTAFNGVEGRRRRRGGPPPVFDGTVASVDQARAPMFWDNRVRSLEAQALEPLKAFEEMRGDAYAEDEALDAVVARLRAIPEYVERFGDAFGGGSIEAEQIGRAIAAFERTLVAMDSPVDRYRAGDTSALTPQQVRGLGAFNDVGCARCHGGPMFSDFGLEAEGVAEHAGLDAPDAGDGRFRFRTPSLRNVALTAPYMHNGTLATLDDVLAFYDEGRSRNPNVAGGRNAGNGQARLSRRFQRVRGMSAQQRADIVAFLEALTDPDFDRTVPARVPSGLPPGGLIDRDRGARASAR